MAKKQVTNLHIKLSFKPLRSVYGWFNGIEGNHCAIDIKSGAPQLEQIETIYHEITHLICALLMPTNCARFLNTKNFAVHKKRRARHIVTLVKSQDQEERLCYTIANDAIRTIKKYLKK